MALKVGELYASFGIDSSGISSTLGSIEKQCDEIASDFAKTGAVLSAAVTAPIVAFGKEVYQVGSEFQAQMSRVQSISEATDTELKELTQTAKDLGASSSFSASQAAEGMEFLASAGFKVEEIIAAMPGMLNLAASSGEDLATSADIAASVLRGFGMEAEDAAHVADVLAKNAAATNAAVYDTGEAMKYVAPLANTMGLSFEEVAASIGLMSNAGIKGSQAGTTLRGALSRLAKPTEVMQVTMDELGLSFYDSEGKMKSLTEMITMLQTNMSGLTEEQQQNALVTLFGQEALSGMMVLLEAGPEALAELTEAYEECDGAAEDMAATMLNNLKGAVEAFGGAVETAQINLYDRFEPAMTSTVQTATELVNSFNLLDDATKDVVYKVAGLAAATGPALIGLGGVVSAVGKLVPLMISLASPIGVVTAGLALFAVAAVDAENDIGKTFVKVSKDIKKSLSSINKQIESSMKKVSKRIPALAQSVSEGLGEIIPEAANTALLVVKGFIDTISSNASDLAGVGLTIIASISDGISRNLPQLIPSAAQMVANIGMALIRNAPKLLQSVATLAKSIWDGIANTDWLGLGEEILSALGDSLEEIVTMFSGWFTDAREAVENIDWSSVWETIKGSFDIASDWLKNLILGDAASDTATWKDVGAKIWTSIKSGISVTGDWIKQLILGEGYTPDSSWSNVGAKLWESIQNGFSSAGDWIKELVLGSSYTPDSSWSDVGSSIWEKIKSGFVAAGDWLKALVLQDNYAPDSSWSEVGKSIWAAIQTGITTTGDWIKQLVLKDAFTADSSWSDVGAEIVRKISAGLSGLDADAIAETIGDLTTIAQQIADKIVQGKADWAAAAGTFIANIVNALSSFSMWDSFAGVFSGIASSVIGGIVDAIPMLSGVATDIVSAIGSLLSGNSGESMLSSMAGIAQTIISGITSAIPTLATSASDIISAIGDLLTGINWESAASCASDVAQSLIDGIVAAIPGVQNAARNIITTIGDVLGGIPWSELATECGGLATAIIDGLLAALKAVGTDFSGIVSAIGDGIVAAAGALGTATGTLVGEFIKLCTDPERLLELGKVAVIWVGEIVKGIVGLGGSMIEGAASFITNTLVGSFRSLLGIEVDTYVEQMMNEFSSMQFDVPTDAFDGLGKACGVALYEAMDASLADSKRLNDALIAWSMTVQSGYAQFMPQFEFLGDEAAVSLYRGLIDGMESGTQTAEESAKQAALLIGLGYGQYLAGGLSQTQPEVYDALVNLVEGQTVNLEALATETGHNIGDLMGFELADGYKLALIDGTPTIISAAHELLASGEAAVAEGWNVDELMAGCWNRVFDTTFAEIAEWRTELTSVLESMGVEAGSLLGVALPDGVAQGLKDGTLSVEAAAAEIAAAAKMTQADVDVAVADNTSKGKESGEAVATGEDAAQPTVATSTEGLLTTVTDTLGSLPTDVEGIASEAMTNMETSLNGGAEPAGTASSTVHDAAYAPFEPLPGEIQETTAEAMASLEMSISNGMAPAQAAAHSVSDTVVKTFLMNMSAANGMSIGTTWVTSVRNGILSVASTLQSTANSVALAARTIAAEVLSYSAGSSIGYQFDNGIAAGIRSGSSAIKSAARSAANAALAAAKAALGIASPSRVAEEEIGWMYDEGIAEGVLGRMSTIRKAASEVTESMHDMFLVDDPARGTVYSSRQAISQTAKKTAEAAADSDSAQERAEAMGRAIADRLIESGALDSDVYMDKDKVGEKVSGSVSKTIKKKTQKTVKGRSLQGVLA